jgi:class 3 adenylate cyclase
MISVEEEIIDTITATFHYLRTGKVPAPIPIPEDLPDNEIRQLITYVNRYLVDFAPFAEALEQLAQGELDTRPLLGGMDVIHSFKTLQSNLRHLTWKTQQIASGDLEQRVDFMGDFSDAFNSMTQQLKDTYEELERRNAFIRKTFGRYTSNEIVEALLDVPDGLELGGEKREVTIMMSDLRGFTALAERLEPTDVVSLLNHYLSAMVDPIQQNSGTIDEIIGDAILVLFGAPISLKDAPRRAIRCALQMQKAMASVNAYNLERGWPEIEMGIAIHTGDVVVGNIGSTKRSKYGVVGRTVNLTARIESFTVGGQVLISPSVMGAVKEGLFLGNNIEIHAKGMREALQCRELLGLEGHPELALDNDTTDFTLLGQPLPILFVRLTEKHLAEQSEVAVLLALSHRRAIMETESVLSCYDNIMLQLGGPERDADGEALYAKVIRLVEEAKNQYLIHFTSVSPGMRKRLEALTGPLDGNTDGS